MPSASAGFASQRLRHDAAYIVGESRTETITQDDLASPGTWTATQTLTIDDWPAIFITSLTYHHPSTDQRVFIEGLGLERKGATGVQTYDLSYRPILATGTATMRVVQENRNNTSFYYRTTAAVVQPSGLTWETWNGVGVLAFGVTFYPASDLSSFKAGVY